MPVNANYHTLLYETVDLDVVPLVNETPTFPYTKRGTLAAVYSATMLAWFADNSNLDKTVGFLDRRLADVAEFQTDQTGVKCMSFGVCCETCKVLPNATTLDAPLDKINL